MIKIDLNSLTYNNNKVLGIIRFRNEGFYFPEAEWNDFVIIILNWWTIAVENLISNRKLTEELLFMDGAFMVKV